MLKEHKVDLLTNVTIKEIDGQEVIFDHEEAQKSLQADQVIIALGADTNSELSDELTNLNMPLTSIGDCTSVGYIHGAIADARKAVIDLRI
jgi:thioredoxin reductase|tara:strand:- start:515 stop:787 length:273 start_codon:yes stop_codon:yes gene_type:complete